MKTTSSPYPTQDERDLEAAIEHHMAKQPAPRSPLGIAALVLVTVILATALVGCGTPQVEYATPPAKLSPVCNEIAYHLQQAVQQRHAQRIATAIGAVATGVGGSMQGADPDANQMAIERSAARGEYRVAAADHRVAQLVVRPININVA